MGDRAYCSLVCRAEDVAKFEACDFTENGVVTFIPAEMTVSNPGADVREMFDQERSFDPSEVPQDVPWYGDTGACDGAYGSYAYVCEGNGETFQWETGFSGGYVVSMDVDGNPIPRQMELLKQFMEAKKRVIQALWSEPLVAAIAQARKGGV